MVESGDVGPHQDLTEKVLKCAFDVQNTLGCGFLEKLYEKSPRVAMEEEGLDVAQQVPLRVHFRNVLVGEYIADLVVEGAVLIEVKATEQSPPIYVAQVINYLKATGLPVGLLLNFGKPRLYYRRLTLRSR
jgi:GxxExxY protein